MPICSIDLPASLSAAAKRTLAEEASAALLETYRIPDVRLFLRPHATDDAAQDGRLGGGLRAVAYVEAPTVDRERKRRLAQRLTAAIAAAYDGAEPMIFIREWPLDNVALNGRLQSDDPAFAGRH